MSCLFYYFACRVILWTSSIERRIMDKYVASEAIVEHEV